MSDAEVMWNERWWKKRQCDVRKSLVYSTQYQQRKYLVLVLFHVFTVLLSKQSRNGKIWNLNFNLSLRLLILSRATMPTHSTQFRRTVKSQLCFWCRFTHARCEIFNFTIFLNTFERKLKFMVCRVENENQQVRLSNGEKILISSKTPSDVAKRKQRCVCELFSRLTAAKLFMCPDFRLSFVSPLHPFTRPQHEGEVTATEHRIHSTNIAIDNENISISILQRHHWQSFFSCYSTVLSASISTHIQWMRKINGWKVQQRKS